MKYYTILKDFITRGLWNIDLQKLPRLKRFGYSILRMLIIAIRGFLEDRCTLQASALTYITLVSLVPILAITLAFCKGIGLQRKLMETIGLEMVVNVEPNSQGVPHREITYRVIPKDEEETAPENTLQLIDNKEVTDLPETAAPLPAPENAVETTIAPPAQPPDRKSVV